jgi:hypothetical protein
MFSKEMPKSNGDKISVFTVTTPPFKPPSSAVRKATIFSFLAAEGSCCEESEPEESPPEESPEGVPEESLEEGVTLESLEAGAEELSDAGVDWVSELPAGEAEELVGVPPQEPRARPSKAKMIFF